MNLSKLITVLAIAVAAFVAIPSGASAQRGRGHVVVAGPRIVVAPMAPPAPPAIVVPAAPYPGAVWTDGYYDYRGGRHVWVDGAYRRPRHGFHWAAHRWDQRDGGWVMTPGGWVRD